MSDRDEPYCEAQVGGMMCGRPVTKWGQQCDYHDPKQSDRDEQELIQKLDYIQVMIWARINDEVNAREIKLTIGDAYALGSVIKEVLHPEVKALIDQVSTRRAAEAEIRVLTELDNAYDEITADNFHEFYIRKVASLQPTKGSK